MTPKRIWLNEHDFMELPTNPLLTEIAIRARTFDFVGMLRYLPNPDIVLKKIGKRMDVYDELLYDGHVGGARTKRKAGVLRSSWYLDHNGIDPAIASYLDRLFQRIDTERLITEFLDAPFYGFQPAEIIFETYEEMMGIQNVVAKPPRWFNFSPENQLQFISMKNWMGEELPPNKFIVAQHDAKHDNPYGHSVLSRCFWPVTFKRGGLPFWARFVEKFGIPFLFGQYPENWTDQNKIDQFRDTLDDMVQDGVAALPAGAKAEVVQANGTSATDIQERFIAAMNSEIAVAILGHSAAVSSTPGKLGSESNVSEASADIVGMDKTIVKKAMNDLIDIAINLNFGRVPRSRFKFIEEQDIKSAQAARDKILAELGVRFHEEYYVDVYGLKNGQFHLVEPVVTAGKMPLFNEDDPDTESTDE